MDRAHSSLVRKLVKCEPFVVTELQCQTRKRDQSVKAVLMARNQKVSLQPSRMHLVKRIKKVHGGQWKFHVQFPRNTG